MLRLRLKVRRLCYFKFIGTLPLHDQINVEYKLQHKVIENHCQTPIQFTFFMSDAYLDSPGSFCDRLFYDELC